MAVVEQTVLCVVTFMRRGHYRLCRSVLCSPVRALVFENQANCQVRVMPRSSKVQRQKFPRSLRFLHWPTLPRHGPTALPGPSHCLLLRENATILLLFWIASSAFTRVFEKCPPLTIPKYTMPDPDSNPPSDHISGFLPQWRDFCTSTVAFRVIWPPFSLP